MLILTNKNRKSSKTNPLFFFLPRSSADLGIFRGGGGADFQNFFDLIEFYHYKDPILSKISVPQTSF